MDIIQPMTTAYYYCDFKQVYEPQFFHLKIATDTDHFIALCSGLDELFYLFLAVLGLHYCVDFSLVVVSGSCSLVVMHRLLLAMASLVVQHGL